MVEPQEIKEDECRHVIGMMSGPAGGMFAYVGEERLMNEYGGIMFDYCPFCGAKIKEGEND